MVVLPPLPGPGMATSGAGEGGLAPDGHGVKVPPALTYPSRPVLRLTPSTYRWTASARPVLLVIVKGSRLGPIAWAGDVAARMAAGIAIASAESAFNHLFLVRMAAPLFRRRVRIGHSSLVRRGVSR